MEAKVFVGLDVAKKGLDVALRPSGETWHVANNEEGLAQLVARLRALHPAVIVAESTRGLERPAVAALVAAGLPVVVTDPRQIRDFARATGKMVKTGRHDAGVLALFGERVRPEPRPAADKSTQLVEALLTRRRQLLEMLVAEKNRLGTVPRSLQQGIREHIRWLGRQIDEVTKELTSRVGRVERGTGRRSKDEWLPSLIGAGQIIGAGLGLGTGG